MKKWNDIVRDYLSGNYQKDNSATVIYRVTTILKKIGLLDKPIEISYRTLDLKYKVSHKDDLKPQHLFDLDKKIQKPVLAFRYEGKEQYRYKKGVNLILEDIKDNSFLLVGIHQGEKEELEINDIRTIYLKKHSGLLKWINKDLLLYADIKKLREIAAKTPQSAEMVNNILSAIAQKHPFNARKSKLFVASFNSGLQGINTNTMQPTYKILPDYSHLINGYEGKNTFIKKGNVNDVLEEIKHIIRNNYRQVSALAQHLKAGTDLQTAYNIWHWSITNIKYKLDRYGYEELRTPARSWADRRHGIDCDDFTILTASILMNLGYSPQLVVVAYNNSPNYAHIFTGLYLSVINGKPASGIIIDPVDKKFNHVIPEITKTKIELMNNITVLSGIQQKPLIAGLGFFQEYTDREQQLITSQAVKSEKNNRKIKFLLAHKGTLIEEPLKLVMPYIHDILPDGTVLWKSERLARYGDNFLGEVEQITEQMLSGIDPDFTEEEVMALTGFDCLMPETLGRRGWFKRAFSKFKKKVSKAWNKVKTGIKKAATAVKNTVKKVAKGAKKVAFAPIRNAFLLLLRVNAFGLATKFYMGYSSYEQLKKYGVDYNSYRELVAATQKTERFFEKMGGKASSFKKAVMSGKKHHPKLSRSMTKVWKAGLRGLGEPATISVGATAASATPFLKKIAQWFKKINFKKLFKGLKAAKDFIPSGKNKNTTVTAQDYEMPDANDLPATRTMQPLNNDTDNTTGSEQNTKTNWLLPAGIAASVLLAIMAIK